MKTLDVWITGSACDNAIAIFDKAFKNYESVNIYIVGAPNDGINSIAIEYAFMYKYPLSFYLHESMDKVSAYLTNSENSAILLFQNDNETNSIVRANTALVRPIARRTNSQVRVWDVLKQKLI